MAVAHWQACGRNPTAYHKNIYGKTNKETNKQKTLFKLKYLMRFS